MPFRLLEIVASSEHDEAIQKILDEASARDRWYLPLDDERTQTRAIVSMKKIEGVLDALESCCNGDERFHALVLAIEASIPKPDEEESSDDDENGESNGERVSRQELYEDLEVASSPSRVFVFTVVLSTVVAAFGLARDNVAVIIGAMVIAPLLGPNAALALATTLGDLKLARHSIVSNVLGVSVAFVLSILFGLIFPIDIQSGEIQSRTTVSLGDIALALAAGCAGSLAFTSAVSSALVGVMVAVALLPPLVVAGMLVGLGEFALAVEAFALLATNVICVNLSSVATFLVRGIRPNTWWEAKRAKVAVRASLTVWSVLLVLLALLIYFAFRDA
jgi:uncharacterized hydrophobic protein (TIGR00341 family)